MISSSSQGKRCLDDEIESIALSMEKWIYNGKNSVVMNDNFCITNVA